MPSAACVRVVIDTNVLIAGLLWRGPPHVLLELARQGTLRLISSSALLTELVEVIQRPKFDAILARSGTSRDHLLQELQQLIEVIEPHPLRAARQGQAENPTNRSPPASISELVYFYHHAYRLDRNRIRNIIKDGGHTRRGVYHWCSRHTQASHHWTRVRGKPLRGLASRRTRTNWR